VISAPPRPLDARPCARQHRPRGRGRGPIKQSRATARRRSGLLRKTLGTLWRGRSGATRAPPEAGHIPGFSFHGFLAIWIEPMPLNARFRTPKGVIEVAPRFGLRAGIPRALRRHGPMTTLEISNLMFWDRSPTNHRLSVKWWANRSQQSATRRAIARLKRDGRVKIVGRRGRRYIYELSPLP
jgi:hypothetical protein